MHKLTILFLGILFLLVACTGTTNKANLSVEEIDGKEIYNTYCVACHGKNGNLGASGAKNLQESTMSLEERIEIITNGKKIMSPFKHVLEENEIEAVARYIENLK